MPDYQTLRFTVLMYEQDDLRIFYNIYGLLHYTNINKTVRLITRQNKHTQLS